MLKIIAILLTAISLRPAKAAQPSAIEALAQQSGQDAPNFARFSSRYNMLIGDPITTPKYVPANLLGAPMYVVPLPAILDSLRNTKVSFMAGNVRVHVFGSKAQNNNGKTGWFLEFYAEGSKKPLFCNVWKIVRIPLIKRKDSSVIEINSRKYEIYIDGPKRRLVITPMQTGESRTIFTSDQLEHFVYETGYPVRMGGTEYRVIYTRDFVEKNNEFAGYSSDRSIVFLFMDQGELKGYHFYERDLRRANVLVTTPQQSSSDENRTHGALTLGLRVNLMGNLEVYYPINSSSIRQR